jgi:hypothetical protein
MTVKQHQYELGAAIQRLLNRIESRLTWFIGLIIYMWINFEFIGSWMSMVVNHPLLQDWSNSNLLGGIVQFGSLGIALLIGKIIARMLIIDLEKPS